MYIKTAIKAHSGTYAVYCLEIECNICMFKCMLWHIHFKGGGGGLHAIAKEPWMPKACKWLWTTGLVVRSFEIIALPQISIFHIFILFSININKVPVDKTPFKATSFPPF